MIRYRALALLLCAAATLSSCEENAVQEIAGPAPGARILFFNFGVNAPGVNFYADETKMTAINSTTGNESTNGVAYGAVGSGGFYGAIAPGQHDFTGRIAAATDKDLPISSVVTTLEDGKHYSFYQSGFYNSTTKTVDAFVVEDPFIANIDFSAAYVRFVNAISNAEPMTLFATHQTTDVETAVGGEVAYKGAGAFTAIPGGVYDLATRYANSTSNAIRRTGVSFLAGRVYTITSRGNITVVSTSAITRPFLDNTANR
ncbi:MAG: DUF4397 domain-containing protein [Gemmatimonadaceae bacterium]